MNKNTSSKNKYLKYILKYRYRSLYKKIFRKKVNIKTYAGRPVLDVKTANLELKKAIESSLPYMAARYGANEINLMVDALVHKKISDGHMENMCVNAGFFPRGDEYAFRFGGLMKESSMLMDMEAIFQSKDEEFVTAKYAKNAVLVNNRGIEPWYTPDDPWSASLKGKRVVIIHPFAETIASQYKKREVLFPGTDILPEFNIRIVKAVQTIAGQKDDRFHDWFEALEYMFQEAMAEDFDVALIGCGAYGFPLAAKIKAAGKQAVHMGGALQILFGIKGNRWDTHPIISTFYNNEWVRPSDKDKPQNASKVEGACYW